MKGKKEDSLSAASIIRIYIEKSRNHRKKTEGSFLSKIHALNVKGWSLKIASFIFAYTIDKLLYSKCTEVIDFNCHFI